MSRPVRRTFAAFSVRHYSRLWATGLLWNLGRWMSIFLCSYLVNQLTHSPFLVQIVGAAFFTPMFLAGAIGGVISDRLDRRRTLRVLVVVLIAASAVMAALNLSGSIEVWMVYPYMLVIGLSMVVDMTSRRALVYDLVGAGNVTNAVALEALAMTGGTLVGGVAGGTLVSLLGIGEAFVLVVVFYAVSLILLAGVPPIGVRVKAAVSPRISQDLRATFALARGNATLVSILGITIVMNAFYFPFTPMVPVFAENLSVNAFWTGILAGSPALGSMCGTLLIARGVGFRRGRAYVGGSVVALIFLGVFAAANWYPMALVALIFAGVGASGFSTMQSALVMTTAADEVRGRALGLLSMCIGILPFAMLTLGGVAQAVGPSTGVISSVIVGLAMMIIWARRRPESQQLV
ncbi:MAG TPA: MFS transporter [Dehalococcoidia bacterium]|nr:MFS transporter [Dehalococcoidia bacterium]